MKFNIFLIIGIVLISTIVVADSNESEEMIVTGNRMRERIHDNIQNRSLVEDMDKMRNRSRMREIINTTMNDSKVNRQKVIELRKEMHERRKSFMKSNDSHRVRLAAQTLSKMEDMVGERGKRISAIARSFNNSINKSYEAERQIRRRNGFSRFIAGGNKKAALQIESEIGRNEDKIEELKEIKKDLDGETALLLEEQIEDIEKEQNRLRKVANKEKNNKGLFGWIWK